MHAHWLSIALAWPSLAGMKTIPTVTMNASLGLEVDTKFEDRYVHASKKAPTYETTTSTTLSMKAKNWQLRIMHNNLTSINVEQTKIMKITQTS